MRVPVLLALPIFSSFPAAMPFSKRWKRGATPEDALALAPLRNRCRWAFAAFLVPAFALSLLGPRPAPPPSVPLPATPAGASAPHFAR